MNLANEISSMESELESLRSENSIYKQERKMLEFEAEQLRNALSRVTAERDHHMVKRGELKVLLDSAGALLVNGVRKYHDEAVAHQQEALKVGSTEEPAPLFLQEKK